MGIRTAFPGADVGRLVGELAGSKGEALRQAAYRERVNLFQDDFEMILNETIAVVFEAPEVRDLMIPLVEMSGSNSIVKRVSNEIARPAYSRPPRRSVEGAAEQAKLAKAVADMDLNRRMDLAARLVVCANHVFLFVRAVGGKLALDVLTPDMVRVIVDPSEPTKAAGYVYDKRTWDVATQRITLRHVVWDDEMWCEVMGNQVVGDVHPHSMGKAPWVEIHQRPRWGKYWDVTTGKDLVAAQKQITLLNALTLKLHKSQGEKQIMAVGETGEIPNDQTLDGQGILTFPPGVQVSVLELQASPEHYLKTKQDVETTIAANYGLSRARLNQEAETSEDFGLMERTAELIAVMKRAELDLFEVVKRVGKSDLPPSEAIAEDAKLRVDFAPASVRVDREALLRIRAEEKTQGLRNTIQDIMEDNPEVETDEEALRILDENMRVEALRITRQRALNIPADATADEPGQGPAQNGAMGPPVRDGKMTKDEAAAQAVDGYGGSGGEAEA